MAAESKRTKQIVHKLIDDLTAISGYAAIVVMQGGPEQPLTEVRQILDRSMKSIVMLPDGIAGLHEIAGRYS